MNDFVLKLIGKIQHYSWGGYTFIPQLLGIEETGKPHAEYWMGAHPSASAQVEVEGRWESLYSLIQQEPDHFIGKEVYQKFGELPYLFKVLDVKDMLSIQVHPTREEAAKGYEAEERDGVPLDAPHRNYKDKNHKPEVMVALSPFWLLHGFKEEALLKQTLEDVPELRFLVPIFEQEGYKGLYKEVMEMLQEKVNEVLLPLVNRELERGKDLKRDEPGYWVAKLYCQGGEVKKVDRGIFSIYFFNIVHLQPCEAIFQGAGVPHAYLEGQNVELMANSDNVLRGGLTTKHIDVPELMKHTLFAGVVPAVMRGEMHNEHEKVYACPVPDFGLSSISLKAGEEYRHKSGSGEIYLVTQGRITVAEESRMYKKGEAFYVLPAASISFTAGEQTLVYKAFVPLP